jgi:hypothetical protein
MMDYALLAISVTIGMAVVGKIFCDINDIRHANDNYQEKVGKVSEDIAEIRTDIKWIVCEIKKMRNTKDADGSWPVHNVNG